MGSRFFFPCMFRNTRRPVPVVDGYYSNPKENERPAALLFQFHFHTRRPSESDLISQGRHFTALAGQPESASYLFGGDEAPRPGAKSTVANKNPPTATRTRSSITHTLKTKPHVRAARIGEVSFPNCKPRAPPFSPQE